MSGSGMSTGDDGCGEGVAIGQPGTRNRDTRLIVEVRAPSD